MPVLAGLLGACLAAYAIYLLSHFDREDARRRRSRRNYAQHRWVGQRAGGPPDMAESYEYVSYCGICGRENHGDPAEFPCLDYPPCEGDDDEPWLRELARAPAPDPEACLAAEDTAKTGRPRVDCPVCGHFSHRKNACRGGMGDYCDCPADDREQAPPPAPRPGVPV